MCAMFARERCLGGKVGVVGDPRDRERDEELDVGTYTAGGGGGEGARVVRKVAARGGGARARPVPQPYTLPPFTLNYFAEM